MSATAAAAAALVLCMAADEYTTRQALHVGARETVISRPEVRLALKVAVGVGFVRKGRHKGVKIAFPTVYCAAGAWNLEQARKQRRQ